ncbi:hypothetical protein D4764_14G0009460, partial [Takifugu flavidus]
MHEPVKVEWSAVCTPGAGVRDTSLERVLECDMESNSEAAVIRFPLLYADRIRLSLERPKGHMMVLQAPALFLLTSLLCVLQRQRCHTMVIS